MPMQWERIELALPIQDESAKKRPGRKGGREGPGRKWGHTLNSVRAGRLVYVFGGYGRSERQTNDVHIYNPGQQKWIKPYVRGTLPPPRDSHTCTAIGSRLYVFGGTDGAYGLNDLFYLDTTSNTWFHQVNNGSVQPQPREGHSATSIGDKLYIFGGCGKSIDGGEDTYFNDVYMFDLETERWTCLQTKGALPAARDSHSCCTWGHQLIVFGGEDAGSAYLNDVYTLDTNTLQWSLLKTSGERPQPRAGHAAVGVGRFLVVFGGFADDRHLFNDLYILDMATGKWEAQVVDGLVPSPRFSLAADLIDSNTGQLFFFGGCNENLEALDDMFLLHTGLALDVANAMPTAERLSLKKELKRRSQMGTSPTELGISMKRPFVEGAPGIGGQERMFSSNGEPEIMSSPFSIQKSDTSGGLECQPVIERPFEGKITDVFHFGYCVEAKVDNIPLEGLLFTFRPGFTQAAYTRMAMRRTGERVKLSNQTVRRRERRRSAKAVEASSLLIPPFPPLTPAPPVSQNGVSNPLTKGERVTEGVREGAREGAKEGEREKEREGVREGERKGERKGEMEGEREGEKLMTLLQGAPEGKAGPESTSFSLSMTRLEKTGDVGITTAAETVLQKTSSSVDGGQGGGGGGERGGGEVGGGGRGGEGGGVGGAEHGDHRYPSQSRTELLLLQLSQGQEPSRTQMHKYL